MPPLAPQKYPEIEAYDAVTASAAQKEMAPAVKTAVEQAKDKKLVAAGFFHRDWNALAIGNKRGNFGYANSTAVNYSVTARTLDGTGSGWASAESFRLKDIDPSAANRTAITKAVLSEKPRRLDPGKYTVILEPAAVSEMMGWLLRSAFNARAAEEGRSFMTKKGGGTRLGEKLFSEKVTIRSDPFDKRNPGAPWSGTIQTQLSGIGQFFFANMFGASSSYLPSSQITWVEKGVVKNLSYSRHWAAKRGAQPTPQPMENAIIEGEDNSLDDLIHSTDRGLLVTHFFYIRFVNPQTIQLTGLTRDGLFMIERGKIAYPLMNFRWNESAPNVLANVEMMTAPVLVEGRLVPAMKVRDFNFSSVSDAV
jgi:predicted Zn-dependent protease